MNDYNVLYIKYLTITAWFSLTEWILKVMLKEDSEKEMVTSLQIRFRKLYGAN